MPKIKEIRIHGRGGQGVVAMAEILAIAFFNNGQTAQAFPHFGVERSGAPIQSFVRFSVDSQGEILSREHVYSPDFLIILDDSLLGKVDLFVGIKSDTQIIVNSKLESQELLESFRKLSKLPQGLTVENIFSADVSTLALDIFGKNIVNTAMLGVAAKIPKFLSKKAVIEAIKSKFNNKGAEIVNKNILIINKILSN